MGRQQFIVVSALAFSLVISPLTFGQGPPQNRRGHGKRSHHGQIDPRAAGRGDPRAAGRERFYQLSPEERQAFQRNAERWLKMTPEQQKILREREAQRRQQRKLEAEAALRQSGLRLEGNARDQFEARYFQERRRIEHQLRQEFEAKRQQQLPQLNERLKSEFQGHEGPSAAPVNPPPVPKNR